MMEAGGTGRDLGKNSEVSMIGCVIKNVQGMKRYSPAEL